MQLRAALLALALPCALTLGLILSQSTDAPAQTENTTVTTPAGATHGALANGHLVKAAGANSVTDSGLPSAAQGNGAKVQLSTGVTTGSDLAGYDANGNTVDSGIAESNLASLGANTFTGLQSLLAGVALPVTTNPTGSTL